MLATSLLRSSDCGLFVHMLATAGPLGRMFWAGQCDEAVEGATAVFPGSTFWPRQGEETAEATCVALSYIDLNSA